MKIKGSMTCTMCLLLLVLLSLLGACIRSSRVSGGRVQAVNAMDTAMYRALEKNFRPLLSLAESISFKRHISSRPDWYSLEHLEAELAALTIVNNVRDLPQTDRLCDIFPRKLWEVREPLDQNILSRICKETDDVH